MNYFSATKTAIRKIIKNKNVLPFFLLGMLIVFLFYVFFIPRSKTTEPFSEMASSIKIYSVDVLKWELDFIKNDLFHNIIPESNSVNLIPAKNFINTLDNEAIVNNNIIIINDKINFDELLKTVKRIKPVIIFHLSDECGDLKEWTTLANHTKLLLRQHNFSNYDTDSYDNTFQIPVGYVSGYLTGKYSLDIKPKKIKDRKHECAFVGQMKSDREYMCDVFEKNFPNAYIKRVENSWDTATLKVSPSQMFDIYSESIFVPVGRGNCSLECFRIYEAILAGAIPVVNDDKNQIQDTFYYNNSDSLPPFIFVKTWDEAIIECKRLIENPEELQELQDKNIKWWRTKIMEIQEKIRKVLL
jgi:hypothetical protein